MPAKDYPSVEYIRQCVRYEDGHLFWVERPRGHFLDDRAWESWNARFSGEEAGTKGARYWYVRINYKSIKRHLVVWALHHGVIDPGVDHENRNSYDDRIENLRKATQQQQVRNAGKRKDNTSGYKGVSWDKRSGYWAAYIMVDKRKIHLGYFDDLEEAHEAYVKASIRYFGEFACSG